MKAIVLAAGYGTRMQSLIGSVPKALIRIGDQTILDHLYANLAMLGVPIHIVTNARDHDLFVQWQRARGVVCQLISDGSSSADDRLGAIGDLQLAIERIGAPDDLLVTAADNLIPFQLAALVADFERNPDLHIAVYRNDSLDDQVRRGVVSIVDGVIQRFEEKPDRPSGLDAAAPLYVIPASVVPEVEHYLAGGGNPDAPGHLMAYLVEHHRAVAWWMPDRLVDVGNPDSYRRAIALAMPPTDDQVSKK